MEASMPAGRFVENDIELKHDDARLLILTGPNMAGKSTILATTGIIQLMAQAGSFVPCSSATIGIADRIYYRAGSYDDISGGKSTFMVELLEVAEILNSGSERSLVMVDELGRGTSTYDGMALAWAVAEHLHDVTRARCLFTTHYHELAALEERLPFARNYHVSVAEKPGEVVFLYRLQRGGTDKSYGLNVAKMAGLPKDVVRRAYQILKQLEEVYDRGGHQMRLFGWSELPDEVEDPVVAMPESEALSLLRASEPEELSPRDALELVFEMKRALEAEEARKP
jgi:DNA mismatch repair protein MutS